MEYSNRLPSDISRTISASRTILCMQVVFMHMVITAPVPQDFDSRFVICLLYTSDAADEL